MKYARILAFCALGVLLCCNLAIAWDLNGGTLEEWDSSPLRPYDIEVLSDGSAWLTLHEPALTDVGKVFTIDPSDGSITDFEAPFDAQFLTLDKASDDTLWIADVQDRLVHFDPTSGAFTGYPLDGATFTLPSTPLG